MLPTIVIVALFYQHHRENMTGTTKCDFWNLAKVVEKWALVQPDKIAFKCAGKAYSYHELEVRSGALAKMLCGWGVCAGDRVAILGRNGIDMVCCFLATIKMGGISVPLNNRLTPSEIQFQLLDSDASLLLFDEIYSKQVQALNEFDTLSGLTCKSFEDVAQEILRSSVGSETKVRTESSANSVSGATGSTTARIDLSSPLALMYTSGTTGDPKGVLTSHLQTFFKTFQVINYLDLRESDVVMTQMPLFHSGALFGLLVPTLSRGATFVTREKFQVETFLGDVNAERPSVICCTTTMLRFVLDQIGENGADFSCVRVLFGGGERTPKSLVEDVARSTGLALRMGYGQTENSFMAIQDADEILSHYGSVGRAGLFTDVWIDHGISGAATTGEIGEIVACGPTVMSGYWRRPEANADTIVDGVLHTGDLGYMDTSGRLYLVDRERDMYRSGAENVYPAEIEKHLLDHPDVINTAVVGVEDPIWGEVGKAFIVCKSDKAASPAELTGFLAERLARYKLPKHFEFLQELPLTSSGKVLKAELKKR